MSEAGWLTVVGIGWLVRSGVSRTGITTSRHHDHELVILLLIDLIVTKRDRWHLFSSSMGFLGLEGGTQFTASEDERCMKTTARCNLVGY